MIAVIAGGGNATNARMVAAWRDLGLDAADVHVSDAAERLCAGDVALARIDVRRSVDGLQPGLIDLLQLDRAGVTVLNPPAALLRSHDKLRTAGRLVAAGVPHPATEHIRPSFALTTLRPPLVVKPRFGSWGSGIQRCDSMAALCRTLSELEDRSWFKAQGALVQTLVEPEGHDLRVLVAGGEVVGAVSRVSSGREWRTNVSLGGRRQPTVPSPRARELALAAAWAVGGDFVGVDLLPDGDDWVVLEVNGAVDFNDTYSFPGRSVYEDIAAALDLPVHEHAGHSAWSSVRWTRNRPLRTMLDGPPVAGIPATVGGVQPGA